MGPYGAASQGELGTFTVPRHRLHKPGPKVSISQVMTILEIQAGYSRVPNTTVGLNKSVGANFAWKLIKK